MNPVIVWAPSNGFSEIWDASHTPSSRREWIGQGNETEEGQQPRPESARIMEGRLEGFCLHGNAIHIENDRERKLSDQIEKTGARKSNELFGFKHSIPSWNNFPTQSPICDGNDGLSSRLDGITFPKWRNESIKAGGNAVVPQVVYQIFKAIEQYETYWNTQTTQTR